MIPAMATCGSRATTSWASRASATGHAADDQRGAAARAGAEHGDRPGGEGGPGEVVPVGPLPLDRGEQAPRGGPARVDDHRPKDDSGRVRAPVQPGPGDPGDLLQRERDHSSPFGRGCPGPAPQGLGGDLAVIERQDAARHVLAAFVALAGHQDHVALGGRGDGEADRGGPVRFHDHVRPAPLRHAERAVQHRREDGQGIFGSRVVAGEDGHVGEARRRGAHQRALGPVPVTAAAEHDDQAALGDRAQRAQHGLDRAGLVRVVDEHGQVGRGTAGVDPFQPPGHAGAGPHAGHRVLQADARLHQGHDRPERVGHVERADEGQRGIGLHAAGPDDPERAAVRPDPDVLGPPVRLPAPGRGERDDGDGRGLPRAAARRCRPGSPPRPRRIPG